MGYTNSPLVVHTKLSPNHSGQRTHSIDRITPHCVVGQLSAESICGCFTSTSRQASCNYGIGTDGRVSLCVKEKNRSWCSSSNANDQRAVTIECASDMNEPYAMNSAVYDSLVKLCIDICKRNGKKKLLWLGDKNKTLNYAPAADEMVLTVHRWFANKSCPGNWLYARLGDLAARVTAALGGSSSSGMQASSLKNLSEAEAVAKIGPLFTANQKTTGILACVSMAQFILESGYGKSELAQNANNCFGMKTSLSGNSWSGSSWDGKSVYPKKTQEQNTDGSYVTITADFRKYACVEDSIADHVELLLNSVDRCIAIRPCEKDNPNAIRWGRLKEGRWCASTLGCRGLAKALFDMMEWEEGLKYRFRGQLVGQNDDKLMLFELDEPEMVKVEEIVLPSKEQDEEGKTVKQTIYIFPPEWAGTFGKPITSIAQVGILQLEHYAGNWDVLRPAAEIEEMNTFTADGLNALLHEAEKIMEGWTDTDE